MGWGGGYSFASYPCSALLIFCSALLCSPLLSSALNSPKLDRRTTLEMDELSRDLPGPYFERAPQSARRRRRMHGGSLSPMEYTPGKRTRPRVRPGTAPSKLIGKRASGTFLAGVPAKMNSAQRYIARQNLKEAQRNLLDMEMELKALEAAAGAEEMRRIEAEEKAEVEALRREEEEARERTARRDKPEVDDEEEEEKRGEGEMKRGNGRKNRGKGKRDKNVPVMTYAQRMRHVSATKLAAVYRGHRTRSRVEEKIVKDQGALLEELAELRKKKIGLSNRKTALEAARAQRKRLLRGIQQRDAVAAQEELAVEEEEPLPFQWPGEEKRGGGGGRGSGGGGDEGGRELIRMGRGRMTMLMSTSQRELPRS